MLRLAAIVVLFASAPALAQTSYSDWDAAGRPDLTPTEGSAPGAVRGGLVVYPDLASFQADQGGGFPVESFDGGLTGAGAVNTCTEPVNSTSNDVCFQPGDLIAGFSMTSSAGGGIVVLGTGFLGAGQTSPVIGANNFAETTEVAFSPAVTAVAMDVVIGAPAAGDVLISAFDAGDALIGSFTVTTVATDTAVFAGFSSPVPVARMELDGVGGSGELLDNLQFGTFAGTIEIPEPQAVPSLGWLGLGLLALLTAIVATVAVRRQH